MGTVNSKERKKEDFIRRAKIIHKGENLDYSMVEYINNRTKVKIIDHDLRPDGTEYGEFWQTPLCHLRSSHSPLKKGDRLCALKQKGLDEVIEAFKKAHVGEDIDYSKVDYVNEKTPVLIVDHTLDANGNEYGEYYVIPEQFAKGRYGEYRRNIDARNEFVRKAKLIHGDKDDYSMVEYKGLKTEVTLVCKEHGIYKQLPYVHLDGKRCPKCNGGYRIDLDEFVRKAKSVHGDKYDYSETLYVNYKTTLTIICPIHGMFEQTPEKHLIGHGCQKCAQQYSKPELEICEFIKSLIGNESVIEKDKSVLTNRELDIFVPSLNVAFEYDGLIWHSECYNKNRLYHIDKTNRCREKGIRLIHIFEDEYIEHKEIVLNKIRHILNVDNEFKTVGGRNCIIEEINKAKAKTFLNMYHLQGFSSSSVYLGAFGKTDGKLYAVMSFVKKNNNVWELSRFATDTNYKLTGVASKMLKYFVRHYDFDSIISFLDVRWNNDGYNMYNKLGFTVDCVLPPDYSYVKDHVRLHKFNFRKERINKKYGLPLSMTEKEMADKLGYYRIWNCGLIRYVYSNKK